MKRLFTDYQERWMTGLALLGLVTLIGIIDNLLIMWLFLGIIYMFAFYEAMKLYRVEFPSAYFWALFLWVIAYFYPSPDDMFFLIAIIFGASLAYFHNFDKRLLLPFLYPTIGVMFFLTLYKDYGISHMFWLLVTVVLTDVGAFFVGKTIGRTKFSSTSPNKTIEGVIGGVLIATVVGTLLGLHTYSLSKSIMVSLAISIASVFGDLFESYLKREAGVKDSGNVLPGHGGVLDRIDGYLFGVVMMVIALRALPS
ncbi:MAG: phosphatidate cytidylyltransferase [Epsilonproteobacteria bacterium]|nr:phosphatidate cytidylyltransferase [Campylobacterota bacterium]